MDGIEAQGEVVRHPRAPRLRGVGAGPGQRRANAGAPGVDTVSINQFAAAEAGNLYKRWNRMSSGSYMPGAAV